MKFVEVCVGSACHIKGSQEIVELMQKSIEQYGLGSDVVLSGSFCTGQCNRVGVTITVDETVYSGITRDSFQKFFEEKILRPVKEGV